MFITAENSLKNISLWMQYAKYVGCVLLINVVLHGLNKACASFFKIFIKSYLE